MSDVAAAPTRRWVLHVDMDQFIAAVELLRRPELVGRPVVVGGRGDPTERAVVSTASYEARAFGLRSGMPLRIAARRCPEAVFLPVDRAAYDAASTQVMAVLRAQPGATVQVLGWDEAFVGVELPADEQPERYADRVRAAVLDATRLHCSVGIGDTTVRAKNATDLAKPHRGGPGEGPGEGTGEGTGTFRLTRDDWLAVLGERPARDLWGIGPRTSDRLAALGVHTVLDLARTPDEVLASAFGPTTGPAIGRLGRGVGPDTADDTPWAARAHGRETTYQHDLTTPEEVDAAVRVLARQVVDDVRAEGRAAVRVFLKVRFAPFVTVNRSRKLAGPTYDADVLADTALALLARLDDDRPVRLLGLRAEMEPPAAP